MIIRPRYFIETKDHLFFAVNTYHHPKRHIVSFLRYVPAESGSRFLGGSSYKKVNSAEAYSYIGEHHPEYLFTWNIENKRIMGVLREDILEVYNPIEKLEYIINNYDENPLYEKIKCLSMIFHDYASIDYSDMGVTGSTLIGLENSGESDIDFIVFGLDNHKKAVDLFGKIKDDDSFPLNRITDELMYRVYKKRVKDNSLTFEEYKFYENRRNNRGLIGDTLFDIMATRNFDEIPQKKNLMIKQLGSMKIRATISCDDNRYDTPSIYHVKDVEVIDGVPQNIEKVLSYTHTYTGIVKNNERVIASGVCEEVYDKENKKKTYNLIVGTSRESINEYIKLEENPLK